MGNWWVENDSAHVRFRGEVADREELEKVIATLSAQLPLMPIADEKQEKAA